MTSLKEALAGIKEREERLKRPDLASEKRIVADDVLKSLQLLVKLRRRLHELPKFERWGGAEQTDPTPVIAFFHITATTNHPAFDFDKTANVSIDYLDTVRRSVAAARRSNPGARIVILSDHETTFSDMDGVEIVRGEVDRTSLVMSKAAAYRDFAATHGGPIVCLDTDVWLIKPISELLDGSFDFAFTYRPEVALGIMPINAGVYAAWTGPAASEVLSRCLKLSQFICALPEVQERFGEMAHGWWSEQLGMDALIRWDTPPDVPPTRNIDGVRLRLMPCDKFNYTPSPTDTAEKLSEKWAIHFKGSRKTMMKRLSF